MNNDGCMLAYVYTADLVTAEDTDFMRLKNDIINAFQAQMDLRSALCCINLVSTSISNTNNLTKQFCICKLQYSDCVNI